MTMMKMTTIRVIDLAIDPRHLLDRHNQLLDPLGIASEQGNTRSIDDSTYPTFGSNTEVCRMSLASVAFLVGAVIFLIPQYLAGC